MALRALLRGLVKAKGGTLLFHDGSGAVALRAGLRGAGMAAGAMTDVTIHDARERNGLVAALGGLLKREGNAGLYVTARPGCVRVGTALLAAAKSAETAAEDAGEDVADVAEVGGVEAAAEAAGPCVGVEGGVAETVILGLLVRVTQDLIGLVDLFELCLGFGAVRVQVRVILLGQLAVCFFDLVFGCALVDTEDFIVVAFFCQG